MSVEQVLQYAAQALFVIVFADVLVGTIRLPLRTNVDVTLLFGTTTLAIAFGVVAARLGFIPQSVQSAVSGSLIMILPRRARSPRGRKHPARHRASSPHR